MYWDAEHNEFRPTPIKELGYSHIVGVVRAELDVDLVLRADASWRRVPNNEMDEIVREYF